MSLDGRFASTIQRAGLHREAPGADDRATRVADFKGEGAWGCLEERMDNIIISSSAIAGELAATGRELQLLQVSQPPLWLPWLPCTGIRGASLCYQAYKHSVFPSLPPHTPPHFATDVRLLGHPLQQHHDGPPPAMLRGALRFVPQAPPAPATLGARPPRSTRRQPRATPRAPSNPPSSAPMPTASSTTPAAAGGGQVLEVLGLADGLAAERSGAAAGASVAARGTAEAERRGQHLAAAVRQLVLRSRSEREASESCRFLSIPTAHLGDLRTAENNCKRREHHSGRREYVEVVRRASTGVGDHDGVCLLKDSTS
ncbi:hypothetical protein HPB51_000898 [Rhipicephalus microplus]|uniref:Uncharacterized protein n=1 Tax=Rhipicephalus microplus TaxID=6941 RepID=A0A9J6DKW8_RHIMP|nr:hypothetical protein HPB51_000898 [Rhipicephalus microplus]